jgi:hypothetical protein
MRIVALPPWVASMTPRSANVGSCSVKGVMTVSVAALAAAGSLNGTSIPAPAAALAPSKPRLVISMISPDLAITVVMAVPYGHHGDDAGLCWAYTTL